MKHLLFCLLLLVLGLTTLSGCGGPTGKGVNKDKDKPVPPKETR